MDNWKIQAQSKSNSKNINNFQNIQQDKILRSKSKNIYIHQKNNKSRINSNTYAKPKISQNNSNLNNNNQNCINNNLNNNNLINKYNNKNSKNENQVKKSDLIQIELLKKENIALKKSLIHQDEMVKNLHDLFIHNYNKINSLKKKYSHYKRFLQKSLMEDDTDNLLKEKLEEEFALRAVEQQIMDEICPNPDSMSYEQLLQLEEEVGNVNKGLTKDKINKIPVKPFRKALFDDNSDCIICMEGFSENEMVKQLICGHIFHGDCIDHWLSQQKNCPFCKAECGNIF